MEEKDKIVCVFTKFTSTKLTLIEFQKDVFVLQSVTDPTISSIQFHRNQLL